MCTRMKKNQKKKQATPNPSLYSSEPSPRQRALDSHTDKIYAKFKINEHHDMSQYAYHPYAKRNLTNDPNDVITAVNEPTDWVNSIVCNITEIPEGRRKIRLYLDPKDLNKNIRGGHYYTRTDDELLPQLHEMKFFSILDTKKGYWQVALEHESTWLCTFNTPFGRYRSKGYPSGSSSAKTSTNANLTRCTKTSLM